MDQPTVSMGAIRLFAVAWPVLYLVLIVPPASVLALAIWFFFEELMDSSVNEWFFPTIFYAPLTIVVCWPVCRDMARQTARYRRLNDDGDRVVSTARLFVQYMVLEVGAIVLLSLGLLWLMD
ncbi:MAG: hypothetical protein AAF085_00265 [Planctomycetota bacterium]